MLNIHQLKKSNLIMIQSILISHSASSITRKETTSLEWLTQRSPPDKNSFLMSSPQRFLLNIEQSGIFYNNLALKRKMRRWIKSYLMTREASKQNFLLIILFRKKNAKQKKLLFDKKEKFDNKQKLFRVYFTLLEININSASKNISPLMSKIP